MTIILNIIERENDYLVTLCDKELLGKTLKEDDIEVFINPKFYNGKEASEKLALDALSKATMGNFFGKESIEIAKKAGLVSEIILIQGVPHAQFIKI